MLYREIKENNPADYKKFVYKYLPQGAKFVKNKKYVTLDNGYVPTTLRKKT